MIVKIIDGADIEARAVLSSDRIGGLMENFTTDGQLLRHLLLQQPAEEPIILVVLYRRRD